MPHLRSLSARRLLAAALLSALCAPPASAAWAQLWSTGNEIYRCTLQITTTDGELLTPPLGWFPVSAGQPFPVPIGELPPGQAEESPRFERLKILCVKPNREEQRDRELLQTGPAPGETVYSIELHRDDPFWHITDATSGRTAPALPRDDTTVNFIIGATTLELQPFYITRAWIKRDSGLASPDFGPLETAYRFSID